jgi:hypothetical protein
MVSRRSEGARAKALTCGHPDLAVEVHRIRYLCMLEEWTYTLPSSFEHDRAGILRTLKTEIYR